MHLPGNSIFSPFFMVEIFYFVSIAHFPYHCSVAGCQGWFHCLAAVTGDAMNVSGRRLSSTPTWSTPVSRAVTGAFLRSVQQSVGDPYKSLASWEN